MEGRCENCLFWKKFGSKDVGECHRRAPSPYKHLPKEEPTLDVGTRWPLTHHTQQCGEFEPRLESGSS